MKSKQVLTLASAVFVIGLLFWHSESDYRATQNDSGTSLFNDLSGEKISGISIEQGEKKTTLVKRDGIWRVKDRSEFQASPSKVRSALLKLLDLNLSQRIAEGGDLTALGVSDAAVKSGRTKLSLLGEGDSPLGAVFFGEERRTRKEGKSLGQLIRRDGEATVWLAPETFVVAVAPEQWIDTELFSIPASKVWQITQSNLPALETNYTLRSNGIGTTKKFQLTPAMTPAVTLNDSVLAQITGAMEASQLVDVMPIAAAPKGLIFDLRTLYQLENGLEYTLDTGKLDSKNYLKVSVRFNPELSKEVSEAFEAASTPKEAGEGSVTTTTLATSKPVPSSPEEASKYQEGYKDWIFEIADYQAERLRQSKESLLKVEPPK